MTRQENESELLRAFHVYEANLTLQPLPSGSKETKQDFWKESLSANPSSNLRPDLGEIFGTLGPWDPGNRISASVATNFSSQKIWWPPWQEPWTSLNTCGILQAFWNIESPIRKKAAHGGTPTNLSSRALHLGNHEFNAAAKTTSTSRAQRTKAVRNHMEEPAKHQN